MRLKLDQGSHEWKVRRRMSVTGSDAKIIMGHDPRGKSIDKLILQKLELEPEEEVNDFMKMGVMLEPLARDVFCKETGILMVPSVHCHDTFTWAMCSTDGINFDEDTILEIKCGMKAFELLENDIIPDYYIDQIQHNLWVTGATTCYYMAYWKDEWIIKVVQRDEAYIQTLVEKETEFYELLANADKEALGIEERDDEAFHEAAIKYAEALALQKRATALVDEAKKDLIALVENRGAYGFGVKITRCSRKGEVDYKMIPELIGIDLDKYRKEKSFYWKFDIKEKV